MRRTDIKCPLTGQYLLDPQESFDYYEYRVENVPYLIWWYNGWTGTYGMKGDPKHRHYHLNKNNELVEDKPIEPIKWEEFKFPLIKAPMAQLIANEIVSVQPMKEHRKDVNWMCRMRSKLPRFSPDVDWILLSKQLIDLQPMAEPAKAIFKFKYKYGPSWKERISTWLSKRALKKVLKKKGLSNE